MNACDVALVCMPLSVCKLSVGAAVCILQMFALVQHVWTGDPELTVHSCQTFSDHKYFFVHDCSSTLRTCIASMKESASEQNSFGS